MPRKNKYRVSISDRQAVEFLILVFIGFCVYLFIRHMEIVLYICVGIALIDTIWIVILRLQHKLTKRRVVISNIVLILLFILLSVVWLTGKQVIFGIVVGVVVLAFVIWQIIKHRKRKTITSDIDVKLKRALEIMDSTAKWYNNEEEANRELVTCLKTQGINYIKYQYKLRNGRTADAKVGDTLIEGKLSPSMEDVDRLLGQLSDYTQYGNKVNVVIYGLLGENARRRINNEIKLRYKDRVFLTYLDNPKRQRVQLAI